MKQTLLTSGAVVLFALAAFPADATTYAYTGTIVTDVITDSGFYEINATGANGGLGSNGGLGGIGAGAGGSVYLASGTVLQIVVGGQGGTGKFGDLHSGGGGGGSFVFTTASNPLVVAGGGGGADWRNDISGGSGQVTANGQAGLGSNGGTAGAAGSGGGAGTNGGPNGYNGGGGAGIAGNGGTSTGTGNGAGGSGPDSFAGGAGDQYKSTPNTSDPNTNLGGFGGGGGGGYQGGGGGGGYSGGGGGDGYGNGSPGGGGGSYLDKTLSNASFLAAANTTGDGLVTIVEEALTAVPEPASLALVSAAMGLLGLSRRRRA